MATLPATGYLSDSARTEAEMQTALEAQRDYLSQIPASAEVQLTISAGTIGNRAKRLLWTRQGFMRSWRVQRFRGTSDAQLSFVRLEAQLEPLEV